MNYELRTINFLTLHFTLLTYKLCKYHTYNQIGRQVKYRKIMKIYLDADLPHEITVLPISRGERRCLFYMKNSRMGLGPP